MSAKLSAEARSVCARWFGMSPRDSLRSHPPHATLTRVRPAIDELISAGLITEAPFNHLGSVILLGSEEACRIGREVQAEFARAMISPSAGSLDEGGGR
jgi:hypothetical protein